MTEEKITLIKNYLRDLRKSELFFSKFRFNFESIASQEYDDILEMFSISHLNLIRKEDPLEKYSYYEDKKLFYNKKLMILIIEIDKIFLIISLDRKTLEKIVENIKDSSIKDFIAYSEPEKLPSHSPHIAMPYPFFLEEFCESKKDDITTDFYDKLTTPIAYFKLGIKENNKLQHYLSFIILCSLLEELFSYISNKEEMPLNEDYNIANCIKKFAGEKWLVTSHPKKSEDREELKILSKEIDGKDIFSKNSNGEGNRINKLLNELKSIRRKYVHFTLQRPNNPSDNLIGICCFGQFLIWCEENGYL